MAASARQSAVSPKRRAGTAGRRYLRSRAEQIRCFAVLPAFPEPGGEEKTATMKLNRRPVAARYAGVIESYAAAGAV